MRGTRRYLLLPAGMERIGAGDLQGAHACFCEAAELAGRFGDTDLAAVARHSRGRVLIRMGETAAGVRLLDERWRLSMPVTCRRSPPATCTAA